MDKTVGDYVTLQRGTTYKGNLVGKPGPALLGLGSIYPGGGFREGDYKTYGGDCPPKLMLCPGDLFVSLKGATKDGKMIGSVARVPPSVRSGRLTQDTVKLEFRHSEIATKSFLYWVLRTPQYRDYCDGRATGSAVVALSRDDFLAYPVPPLSKTRLKVVELLEAVDKKIELNRQMNGTLETMARALFQSWFVDFDPVRAKLDGRTPVGVDASVAPFFPNVFQDSEVGRVPHGWTFQPVGEIVDCVGGGTPSTAEPKYWEGGVHHWTTPKDFSSLQSPVLLDTDRKLTDTGIAKISSGLLPAGTLLLSSRAPVGYLAIAAIPVAINQGFIALKCNERASNFFMLNWCQTNMAEIESRATGTTFAEISKQNFRPILVLLPPKELVAAFTTKVAPLYAQITTNLRQSRSLTILRDTLLSKLLSEDWSERFSTDPSADVQQLPKIPAVKTQKATDEFVEALVISQLVQKTATSQYPLGRKRYNKMAYLAHRKAEEDVTKHYLKKAAGPYSPWARYGGPERIALQNKYVRKAKVGNFDGLLVDVNVEKIERYLPKYPVCGAVDWVVENFRYRKNDELELLTTVDFASLELMRTGKVTNSAAIRDLIAANQEWAPKLDRTIFSLENIDRALGELATFFDTTYKQ